MTTTKPELLSARRLCVLPVWNLPSKEDAIYTSEEEGRETHRRAPDKWGVFSRPADTLIHHGYHDTVGAARAEVAANEDKGPFTHQGWNCWFDRQRPITGRWVALKHGVTMCAGLRFEIENMIDLRIETR